MRIVTRISTAGVGGFMSMPFMKNPGEAYVLPGGKFDEVAVRKELSDHPGIQISSDDNGAVLSFAVELMDRMRIAMDDLVNGNCGVRRKSKDAPVTAAERRFDKGRITFVRVDIRHGANGFRAKVSVGNPRDVVGNSENFARLYAQAYADNLVAIGIAMREYQGGGNLAITEGDGCEGIVAEAERRNEEHRLRKRYSDCPFRRNGQCSPCQFGCELYENGRCKWKW